MATLHFDAHGNEHKKDEEQLVIFHCLPQNTSEMVSDHLIPQTFLGDIDWYPVCGLGTRLTYPPPSYACMLSCKLTDIPGPFKDRILCKGLYHYHKY